jgi:hypothetical protein
MIFSALPLAWQEKFKVESLMLKGISKNLLI